MDLKFFKARETILQMLCDRGYKIDVNKFAIDFSKFRDLYNRDNIDIHGNIFDTRDTPVYVRMIAKETYKDYKAFSEAKEEKGESPLNRISDLYGDKKVHIIVVLIFTNPKREYLVNDVEFFPVDRMTYNVTHHEMVNPHRILSEEEKMRLYEKYNANKTMLHKICIDDPINQYYNGEIGDVYEITRGGYLPSYRVVVSKTLPKYVKSP